MIADYIMHWTQQLTEKPLYICAVGSRMCGYHEPSSDWDFYIVCEKENEKIKAIYQSPTIIYQNEQISIRIQTENDMKGLLDAGDAKIAERLHSPIVLFEKQGFKNKWQSDFNKEKILENYLFRIKNGVERYEDKLKAHVYAYRMAWTAWHYMKYSEIILDYQRLDSIYSGYHIASIGNLKRFRNGLVYDEKTLEFIYQLTRWRIEEVENEMCTLSDRRT